MEIRLAPQIWGSSSALSGDCVKLTQQLSSQVKKDPSIDSAEAGQNESVTHRLAGSELVRHPRFSVICALFLALNRVIMSGTCLIMSGTCLERFDRLPISWMRSRLGGYRRGITHGGFPLGRWR